MSHPICQSGGTIMINLNVQLELGLPRTLKKRAFKNRPVRIEKARWWFDRMRHSVAQASRTV